MLRLVDVENVVDLDWRFSNRLYIWDLGLA
jgi:hypothetical protein